MCMFCEIYDHHPMCPNAEQGEPEPIPVGKCDICSNYIVPVQDDDSEDYVYTEQGVCHVKCLDDLAIDDILYTLGVTIHKE